MAMIDPMEAEQSILGCMLMDRDILPDVFSFLMADDFKYQEHSRLFCICKELFNSNVAVDLITVMGRFGSTPEHKVFITQLYQIVPSTKPYREYMRLVKESAKRRKAYELTVKILSDLDENASIADCMSTSCDITQALLEDSNESSFTPLEGFSAVYSKLGNPRKYISTGFCRLDKHVKIDRGDYIVVSGRPSAGKTAFTLQMMLNVSRTYKAVYFSLETNKEKIFERLMSTYSGVALSEIKSGELKDYSKLCEASNSFCKLKFSVVEASGWTVDQIQAESVRQKADLIFIDYISLIKGKGKNGYEQVTGISKDLHIMAQKRKIATIVLSQLNRAGVGEPSMSDLRESGQIEQDADAIIMLYSKEELGEERILKIAKNKEGLVGKLAYNFDGENQRFYEIENRYE